MPLLAPALVAVLLQFDFARLSKRGALKENRQRLLPLSYADWRTAVTNNTMALPTVI